MNKRDAEIRCSLWAANAEFYGTVLTKPQLKMYLSYTDHLPVEVLKKALKKLHMDPDVKFMPRPGQVIQIIKQSCQPLEENDATEIAQKLWEAAGSFGYFVNPKEFEEKTRLAKKALGEEIWPFVERRGWGSIVQSCKECGYNQTTWIAQNRDTIAAFIRRENRATQDKISNTEKLTLDDLKSIGLEFNPKLLN